jgi:hypothetical protein
MVEEEIWSRQTGKTAEKGPKLLIRPLDGAQSSTVVFEGRFP